MLDERGATWKLFLPTQSNAKMLAIGLTPGQLTSLARTWLQIDHYATAPQKQIDEIPKELQQRLSNVSIQELGPKNDYDILVINNSPPQNKNISKLISSMLATNSILVTLGFSKNKLNISQVKVTELETYAVLPSTNPRILFPLKNKNTRCKGLSFHMPGRLVAQIGIQLAKLMSNLGITIHLNKDKISIIQTNGPTDKRTLQSRLGKKLNVVITDLILYCGSETVQRKITALAIIDGGEDLIVKIADTTQGKNAICRESKALRALQEIHHDILYPRLILEDNWAGYLIQVQTNLPKTNNKQTQKLSNQHIETLTALFQLNRANIIFGKTSCYAKIQELSNKQKKDLPPPIAKLLQQISQPEFQKQNILCHRIHGDFAPWNMDIDKDTIMLWDWEDSVEDGLIFFDIFHFVIRQSILVGPWLGVTKLFQLIKVNCGLLRKKVNIQVDIDHLITLKSWLVLEYLRNPHERIIEIASHLENLNG